VWHGILCRPASVPVCVVRAMLSLFGISCTDYLTPQKCSQSWKLVLTPAQQHVGNKAVPALVVEPNCIHYYGDCHQSNHCGAVNCSIMRCSNDCHCWPSPSLDPGCYPRRALTAWQLPSCCSQGCCCGLQATKKMPGRTTSVCPVITLIEPRYHLVV